MYAGGDREEGFEAPGESCGVVSPTDFLPSAGTKTRDSSPVKGGPQLFFIGDPETEHGSIDGGTNSGLSDWDWPTYQEERSVSTEIIS